MKETFLSEFDLHRQQLISEGSVEEWHMELRRYLRYVPADVTRDTDIIDWWSVSTSLSLFYRFTDWCTESRYSISYIGSHRPRRPPQPSIIRSM